MMAVRKLMGVLQDMSAYGWAPDYPKQQEAVVRDITVEQVKALARAYLAEDRMTYLVVGDAETQLTGLASLGMGAPALITME